MYIDALCYRMPIQLTQGTQSPLSWGCMRSQITTDLASTQRWSDINFAGPNRETFSKNGKLKYFEWFHSLWAFEFLESLKIALLLVHIKSNFHFLTHVTWLSGGGKWIWRGQFRNKPAELTDLDISCTLELLNLPGTMALHLFWHVALISTKGFLAFLQLMGGIFPISTHLS